MQSATTVACSGNGIKRTASNALVSDASSPAGSSSSSSMAAGASTSGSGVVASKDDADSPPPPQKRSFIVVESPIKLGTVSSAEDLDIKVLRIQNKNLSERLLQRQKLEEDMRERIEELQNRKVADDSKLCIVDRYWTQLDEDMRLMLERFDETANAFDDDSKSASSTATNNKENSAASGSSQAAASGRGAKSCVRQFLSKLNDWDRTELDEALKDRVKFTTQTLAKLITNYERLVRRNELYFKELSHLPDLQAGNVQTRLKELHDENIRLNEVTTKWESKFHSHGLDKKQLEDKIAQLENDMKEMNKRSSEIEYERDCLLDKAFKLDRQLADTIIKLNNAQKMIQNNNNNSNNSTNSSATDAGNNNHINNHCDQNGHIILHNNFNPTVNACASQANSSNPTPNTTNPNAKINDKAANLTDKQLSDMEFELEQQREVANSRLHELEKLNLEYQAALKQIEKLKAEVKTIPDSMIEQSAEYKSLQTKYSYIVYDNTRLKASLDETRQILEASRANFDQKIKQLESDELAQQKKLGMDMSQMEEQLCQLRKENDLMRIDFEQNAAASEQTGKINKEMRSLISTLQANNKLLKSESARWKARVDELQVELERAKKHAAQQQSQLHQAQQQLVTNKKDASNNESGGELMDSTAAAAVEAAAPVSKKEDDEASSSAPGGPVSNSNSKDSVAAAAAAAAASREIRDLKERNRRLQETIREIRVIVEATSKSAASPDELKRLKEALDKLKATLAASNKPLSASSPGHHGTDETSHVSSAPPLSSSSSNVDYLKKIRSLEETVKELHKSLNNKRQEEAALLKDMELTGEAFEEMQEQNTRLVQQLKEKDDVNFKLVSERIKLESAQKILKEEKETYMGQVVSLQEQHESQLMVAKKLEEQIQQLMQKIVLLEKETFFLHQATMGYKRQAIENVQLIQELKNASQKYLGQLKEAQTQIGEKSELLAAQTFSNKRAQEEIKHLRAKLERQKRFEMAANMDDVLREEIKEYKEMLRCPSCKTKQKDAVLTKCFHVFCHDCLQKRYDTRQRKCPKCNANFGANDFRRLFLS